MTLETPMRCTALAEQLDEPMIGSVDVRTRWLLVEDHTAWGSDAVKDLFGAAAVERAKQDQLGLLLVRRREGDPADDATRRVFLVDSLNGQIATRVVERMSEISLASASTEPPLAFGEAVEGPLFLVCTNGKRDACCALRGRALMGAMAASHAERTWECTHLGGHRFAGNLVCLPDGIVYGRVGPLDGPRLADAYRAGQLEPSLMRGRSAWTAPVQVAEQELRARLGLTGRTDVQLVLGEDDGERAEVSLRTADGVVHEFQLVGERLAPARATSCRGDKIEEPLHWRVRSTA